MVHYQLWVALLLVTSLSHDCRIPRPSTRRGWVARRGSANFYTLKEVKRVRLFRRGDGYYVQCCISVDLQIDVEPSGKVVGLDLGLKYFIAGSDGETVEAPGFYRKSERQLNRANHKKSKKYRRCPKELMSAPIAGMWQIGM